MSRDYLLIGDAHATPEFNNKRFNLLGKLECDLKPDVVIQAGDWYDMHSLFSVKTKEQFKRKAYNKDVQAGIDAQERRLHDIKKRKRKRARSIMLGGNHDEGRIKRVSNFVEGISVDDLKIQDFGWEYIPFLDPFIQDEIAFCHYVQSGNMGNALSSENHASALLKKKYMSTVVWHTHKLDFANDWRVDGKKIFGLVGGCFVDYKMAYAQQANDSWWPGVIHLTNVESNGSMCDMRFISLKTLEKEYA